MITIREAVEQAILVAVGAASLTRERAEAIVDELVRRGQLGEEDRKAVVERLTTKVTGDGTPVAGLRGRLGDGVHGALRELGVVLRGDLDPVVLRVAGLEHRVKLLEAATGTAPGAVPPAGEAPEAPAGPEGEPATA